MNAAGKVKLAVTRLIGRYPLHGAILAGWNPIEDSNISTMCVGVEGISVRLRFNSKFVNKLELEELIGVLVHETNHVLGEHIWMRPTEYPDDTALTIACEVTANEFIREPLPGNPITLKRCPRLPPDEDADTRYHRMARRVIMKVVTLDDHLWEKLQANPILSKAIIGLGINVALKGLTKEQLQQCSPVAVGQAEKIAGEAKIALENHATGKVNWRMLLRHYVGQVLSRRATFSRPPRRFPHLLGIVPGHSWQGGKPNILAIMDTSASLSNAMLQDISRELSALAQHHKVTVVVCDKAIREVFPFKPITSLKGRGGTDLRPPLAPGFLRKHRADLAIYFTDGYGEAPSTPPIVPVIWCLTPSGRMPAPWGREVRLESGKAYSNSVRAVEGASDSATDLEPTAHSPVQDTPFSVHGSGEFYRVGG